MDKDFFREDSKLSSMRWALVQVTRMSWILILAGAFHIVYYTLKFKDIQWEGVSLLILGLTGFLGAAVTGKWLQKKDEVKDGQNS